MNNITCEEYIKNPCSFSFLFVNVLEFAVGMN
jgi:hypothetical protein